MMVFIFVDGLLATKAETVGIKANKVINLLQLY
jgi:hypothetical protein